MSKKQSDSQVTQLTIPAPNFQVASFTVVGTAPLVGNKFSARARADMRAAMAKLEPIVRAITKVQRAQHATTR